MAHRWRTAKAESTTARGYGNAHQKERKRRLPLYGPHDPCGYCGRPLGPDRGRWHLPHNTTRTGYLPGFWHDTCNRSEGAVRGSRLSRQSLRPQPRGQSRRW